MQHIPLTDSQVCFLVGALQVAAAQYRVDARNLVAYPRSVAQFNAQAKQADELAVLLEGADVVVS